MNYEDIIEAKKEAEKFIAYVRDFQDAEAERKKRISEQHWIFNIPVETGLVRAQSLILSRALSAMRNPYCARNERKRK